MLEKALRKIAFSLGVKALTVRVRAAAEGKYGEGWKSAYWWAVGVKRYTAVVLGAMAAVLAVAGDRELGVYVGAAGGLLYALGFLDASWREASPAEVLRGSAVYRFLADHSATITSLLATAAAFVEAGHCGGHDCDLIMRVLVGAGAALAYLGCADSAWRARPPLALPVPR